MSEVNSPGFSSFDLLSPNVAVYPRRRRRYWLHALLLFLTLITMLMVGARFQYNFDHNLPLVSQEAVWLPVTWIWQNPWQLVHGIPFATALIVILLAHEMGHYLYCERYGIYATLPYFIPAPTLIGTFGAFIRIKSPIRTRKALFDVGIAGPIAGFVVGVPVLFVSLALSHVSAAQAGSDMQLGYPGIFFLAQHVIGRLWPHLPLAHAQFEDINLHPVALAAWVGMFATALNLIPGGQLDGGHILFAVWPRAHRWLTRALIGAFVPMGIWWWQGWFVWAALLLATGLRHPPVWDFGDIGTRRRLLSLFALAMFLLTVTPAPIFLLNR